MPAFIIADFSIIIFALGLFIIFWAAMPLIVATGAGIAQILRGFPAIGDDMADWVMARTHDVERFVQNTMENAVHAGTQPFVDLMNGYANTRRVESYSQRDVMQNIVGLLAQVQHAQQHQVTQPVVDTVNHTVTNNVENTNNYITQVVGVNQQYVDETYGNLATWASTAIQLAYDNIGVLSTDLTNLGDWTAGELTKANVYAAAVAETARTDAVEQANQYTTDSFTTLEGYVQQTVEWEQGAIAATQEWTQGVVNQGVSDVTDIAAGLTTLVISNVIPRVATIEQDIEKCLRPMCEAGPGFLKGISSLLGLLGSAELAFALVEMVTDPEGSAKTITDEAESLIDTPLSVVNGLFGTNFSLRG